MPSLTAIWYAIICWYLLLKAPPLGPNLILKVSLLTITLEMRSSTDESVEHQHSDQGIQVPWHSTLEFLWQYWKHKERSLIRRISCCCTKPYLELLEQERIMRERADILLTTCSRARTSHLLVLTSIHWEWLGALGGGVSSPGPNDSTEETPQLTPLKSRAHDKTRDADAQSSSSRPRNIFLHHWYICFCLN